MSEKFQAEMKELDEKFAEIPENLKKRYDKHRLIRCSSMVFLALLFGITSVASLTWIFRCPSLFCFVWR